MKIHLIYNVTQHSLLQRGLGLLLLLLSMMSFRPAGAQSFTDQVQRANASGKVTIHQDAAISDLVNAKAAPAATTPRRTTQTTEGRRTTTTPTERRTEGTTATTTQAPADTLTARQHQRTHKVSGYRIQVYTGGSKGADKKKAYQVKEQLARLLPQHKGYVKFYSPNWTCRIGNFRTMAEAREVLQELVRMGYDTAFPLRGVVEVPY